MGDLATVPKLEFDRRVVRGKELPGSDCVVFDGRVGHQQRRAERKVVRFLSPGTREELGCSRDHIEIFDGRVLLALPHSVATVRPDCVYVDAVLLLAAASVASRAHRAAVVPRESLAQGLKRGPRELPDR
jgi:hypothetical protein